MILVPFRKLFMVFLWLVSVPALAWDDSRTFQDQGSAEFLASGGGDRLEKLRGLGRLTKKFENIYVFGDSLSDIDTVAAKSGGAFPPLPFYWGGRFTNGPTWGDYFAETVQVPLKSFAHAGALLVGQNNFYVIPPLLKSLWVDPVVSQLNEIKKVRSRFDSKDLLVIWAGNNDYLLFPARKSIDENISAVKDLIGSLQQLGAGNFVVINIPDVSRTPFHRLGIGRSIMDPHSINLWVKAHNTALSASIEALRQETPNMKVALVDMYSAFTEVLDQPEEFGFTETAYPCIGGQLMPGGFSFAPFDLGALPRVICQNRDEFFFWDPWHPSTRAHCLASVSLLSSLADQAWVEGYDKELGRAACS